MTTSSGPLKSSHWKRKLGRLELVDADLRSAMMRLDRIDPDDLHLPIQQAKDSVARARAWVSDTVVCVKVDNGVELD